MKDLGKWMSRFLIVLLADLVIDYNCHNMKHPAGNSHPITTTYEHSSH